MVRQVSCVCGREVNELRKLWTLGASTEGSDALSDNVKKSGGGITASSYQAKQQSIKYVKESHQLWNSDLFLISNLKKVFFAKALGFTEECSKQQPTTVNPNACFIKMDSLPLARRSLAFRS